MSGVAPVLRVPARTAGKDRTARAPEVTARAGRRLLTPWVVTITATAVSTCALDGVATAAGVLLVASGALRGLQHWQTLVLLAASYAAWGAGLRANLRANWTLLEQTATSTNALSKAAHDLTKLRTASVRARRIAAAAGYLGTELAKEAPYYAGAVRRGRPQRLGLLHRRDRLPRRHEPRRRRLRVRARPPHPLCTSAAVPADACLHRDGPGVIVGADPSTTRV